MDLMTPFTRPPDLAPALAPAFAPALAVSSAASAPSFPANLPNVFLIGPRTAKNNGPINGSAPNESTSPPNTLKGNPANPSRLSNKPPPAAFAAPLTFLPALPNLLEIFSRAVRDLSFLSISACSLASTSELSLVCADIIPPSVEDVVKVFGPYAVGIIMVSPRLSGALIAEPMTVLPLCIAPMAAPAAVAASEEIPPAVSCSASALLDSSFFSFSFSSSSSSPPNRDPNNVPPNRPLATPFQPPFSNAFAPVDIALPQAC